MRRPEVVEQIKQVIENTEPTATAILYGSEARGDARVDSDIDLLILLEGDQRDFRREEEISGALYDVELSTGVLISPDDSSSQTMGEPSIQDSLLRKRHERRNQVMKEALLHRGAVTVYLKLMPKLRIICLRMNEKITMII